MSDNVELLERLADCVRLAIEDGTIPPSSYVGVAWRDYVERYRFQSVTDEVQARFDRTGSPLVPKVAIHKAQPAPAPVSDDVPRGSRDERPKATPILTFDEWANLSVESRHALNVYIANAEALARLVLDMCEQREFSSEELRRFASLLTEGGG